MAQLRVNGRVQGRSKPRRDPSTCSGFPMINTYDGMGIMPTGKHATAQLYKGGDKPVRSRFGHNVKLAKQNLAHRCHPRADLTRGLIQAWYESADEASRMMDRSAGRALAVWQKVYSRSIQELRHMGAVGRIDELTNKEKARGKFYFKPKFA